MLDNLLEIEIAFNMLQDAGDSESTKDPIDTHFEKLKTEMTVLDRKSDEFKILEKYVKNTHASTHTMYSLQIEQVMSVALATCFKAHHFMMMHSCHQIFKIRRKGEKKRFAKFDKLDNRMLLWHGSRTTNYAGILSQVRLYFT